MSTAWHLAQLNIATANYDLDDPRIADFVNQLDEINGLAEQSRGFVWRLKSDSGNALDIQLGDDPKLIVNMSVWETPEELFEFVYKTAHRFVMARRKEWFQRPNLAYQVLWWVPAGHAPTVEEGFERLQLLRAEGPTSKAFHFKSQYPAPDTRGGPTDLKPEPYCHGWS